MKKATHFGKINIGGKELSCAILVDKTRILTQTALFQAFGRSRTGRKSAEQKQSNLPVFMLANNLKPFIDAGLSARDNFEEYYIGKDNRELIGYNAEILPHICDSILKARDAGILTETQKPLADISDMLVRNLAKIGIIALIDEATGYQDEREQDALNEMFKMFLSEDLIPWQQKFPHIFYKELFRLNGWEYTAENLKKKPSVIGKWTNKLIYEQMPPGVLEELKKKSPKTEKGNRKNKLFQFLSEDIGDPTLSKLLSQSLTLFGLSDSMKQMWQQFEKLVSRQKGFEQLELPFVFDEKGHTIAPIEDSELTEFDKNLKKAIDFNE